MIAVGAVQGQYPFGENTLLAWDMNWQYAAFFSYLHDFLHGNASCLYTLCRAVGGDMTGVFAYYLMSPYNLVFYFTDAAHIYAGIAVVLVLKVGSSGASMYYYLSRERGGAAALIFSTAYALSAYTAAYWFNIMWLDAVILLPLVVLGIRRLAEEGKWLFYTLALAAGIITNFYMGYMLCLFSVLYFICYYFIIRQGKRNVRTILVYMGSSILGGMLSMWILLPVVYAMQGGKANADIFSVLRQFGRQISFRELLPVSFLGTISAEQITGGKPLLYCGVLTLFLVVWWFVKGGEWRRKLGYFIMLCALLVSFVYTNLSCMWHGFQVPMGSPYRFSFLYVFVLLETAWQAVREWQSGGDGKKERICLAATGILLVAVLLLKRESFDCLGRMGLWMMNVAFVIAYAAVMTAAFRRYKRAVMPVLLGMMCAELFLNMEYLYRNTVQYTAPTTSEYAAYMEQVTPLVEFVKKEQAVARTVLTGDAYWSVNDSFLLHLYGLDSYTSVEKAGTQLIGRDFGYASSLSFGMHYENGSTKASESFLGVKYQISSENPGEGYRQIAQNGSLMLYENENALPLAFIVGKEIEQVDSGILGTFAYLNALFRCLDENQEADIFEKLELEAGYRYSDDTGDYAEYEVRLQRTQQVYMDYAETGAESVTVFINDNVLFPDEQGSVVKSLGTLGEDDVVRIRFKISEEQTFMPEKAAVYGEDMTILAAYASEVKQQDITISCGNESEFTVRCASEREETAYLLCTIPYDEGWQVKVDGKVTEALDINYFLVVPLEWGEHEIEISYRPRGMAAGMCISFAALVFIGAVTVKNRLRRA